MACTANIRQIGDVAIVDLSGRITLGDGSGIVRETVKDLLKKGQKVFSKHAIFIISIAVLLIYAFIVLRVNSLAGAEPSDDAETVALAKASVPRIDKKAIQQIQSLEQTNTQVKALFDQARNNPFQE